MSQKLREFFEIAAFCASLSSVSHGAIIAAKGVNHLALTPEAFACIDANAKGNDCSATQEQATMDYERAPQRAAYGSLLAVGSAMVAYSLYKRKPG